MVNMITMLIRMNQFTPSTLQATEALTSNVKQTVVH